jgi:hypothetical protein
VVDPVVIQDMMNSMVALTNDINAVNNKLVVFVREAKQFNEEPLPLMTTGLNLCRSFHSRFAVNEKMFDIMGEGIMINYVQVLDLIYRNNDIMLNTTTSRLLKIEKLINKTNDVFKSLEMINDTLTNLPYIDKKVFNQEVAAQYIDQSFKLVAGTSILLGKTHALISDNCIIGETMIDFLNQVNKHIVYRDANINYKKIFEANNISVTSNIKTRHTITLQNFIDQKDSMVAITKDLDKQAGFLQMKTQKALHSLENIEKMLKTLKRK